MDISGLPVLSVAGMRRHRGATLEADAREHVSPVIATRSGSLCGIREVLTGLPKGPFGFRLSSRLKSIRGFRGEPRTNTVHSEKLRADRNDEADEPSLTGLLDRRAVED